MSYHFRSPTHPTFAVDEENPPQASSPPAATTTDDTTTPPPPPFHIHPYHGHGKPGGHCSGGKCAPKGGKCGASNEGGCDGVNSMKCGSKGCGATGGSGTALLGDANIDGGGKRVVIERTGSTSSIHSAGSMSSSIPSITDNEGGGRQGGHDQSDLDQNDDKLDKVMFGGGKSNISNSAHTGGKRAVVKIRDAHKRYFRKGAKVLDGYSMSVEEGTIYSLLGSSGCGKTTVLTCILGMRHVDRGNIFVFGKRPGSRGSEVPGRRVGYMPQDIALNGLFSIEETLFYYGKLYGMSLDEIKSRRDFLISFLDLPEKGRHVQHLSAGQQRRVSFAVALVHSPGLLVLDEPTVGVDALLRERIWEYLKHLVAEQGTTIIITTHYIEEARTSSTIGLMRSGRLLEENDPATLLKVYNAALLEEIVLALCRNDKRGNYEDMKGISSRVSLATPSKDHLEGEECWAIRERRDSITSWTSDDTSVDTFDRRSSGATRVLTRIQALILKKVYVMWRNILLVLFMVMTPSLMVLLICNGIGNDPKPIHLAVVNHEASMQRCEEVSKWKSDGTGALKVGCDMQYLSCKYLNRIPTDSIKLKEYETEFEAHEAVSVGDVFGYISFPVEFSDNLITRTFGGGGGTNMDILTNSFITYQLDMSSKLIGGFVKQTLFDTYQAFLQGLLSSCGLNPLLGERPVRALPPIYGADNTDLREYIAPSCLLGFLFFFPMCCTSVMYIMDKKQGTLERARVAGVRTSEIMISYFVVEGMVLIIKLALSLTIICVMFGFEVKGSIPLLVSIYMFMGIGGVSAGFLLASFCNEEVQAVLLAMAGFFPNFLLSGLLWPIESMPYAMRYMTYVLPCTFPAEAVRSIMSRGWGLEHTHVYPGLLTVIAWPCIYWALTILVTKVVLRRR